MVRFVAAFLLALAALAPGAARAQRRDSVRVDSVRAARLSSVRPDSGLVRIDSVRAGDVVVVRDTLPPASSRTLREPVRFSARDRLSFVFDSTAASPTPTTGAPTLGDVATLTGDARIQYGKQVLEGYEVALFIDRDEVRARGLAVDTGMVGRPRFAEGDNQITSAEIAYNLRTERGRFIEARTKLDDGFVRARTVAIGRDSTVYARRAVFTTCPCVDDPSYSLRAERMKIVDGKRIFTGPIQLFLFNIATPIALPFGFLPATEGRRSGPLAPTYGEDYRGFYLQNLGWYFPISDYLDFQVTGSLWSRGSFEMRPRLRYARRYRMTGSVELAGGINRTGEVEDPDYSSQRVVSVRWTHSQTVSPRTNFNANVDLSSSGYLRGNSQTLVDRTRQEIGSTITYATRWPASGRALNATLSQRQTLSTGAATLRIPDLSFSQTERRPFARRGVARGAPRWYESVTYRYSGTLTNGFTFSPIARRSGGAERGVVRGAVSSEPLPPRHRQPLRHALHAQRAPRRAAQRVVQRQRPAGPPWASRQRRSERAVRRAVGEPDAARHRPRHRRGRCAAGDGIRGGAAGDGGAVGEHDRLRHLPGPRQHARRALRRPAAHGAPESGRRVRAGLLRGAVQLHPRDDLPRPRKRADRGADGADADPAVDPVDRHGGADVLARQRLRDARASARIPPARPRGRPSRSSRSRSTAATTPPPTASASRPSRSPRARRSGAWTCRRVGSVSPYRLRADGRGERPDYDVSLRGLPLGRLQRFSLSGATNFSSRRRGDARLSQRAAFDQYLPGQAAGVPLGGYPGTAAAGVGAPGAGAPFVPVIGAAPYADFSIPWSVSLDVSYTYSENLFGGRAARALTTNSRFDANVTPRWKVQGTTGLDLTAFDISTSSLAILRDFDCWEMSLNWVPFGAFRSYGFNLQVKSGKLRELLRIQVPRQDPRRVLTTLGR